ncbi:MAG TPA: universal stress protein [Minicystis sp.]|nr:universal stress protein [Minicystis sp.]
MRRIRHILVPLDSGDGAAWALMLARATGAKLILLHVCPVPAAPPEDDAYWPIEDLQRAGAAALKAAAKKLKAEWPLVETLIATGSAADEILAVVTRRRIDVVVMSARAPGPESALLERVAETVAHRCPVPVLTVTGAVASPAALATVPS